MRSKARKPQVGEDEVVRLRRALAEQTRLVETLRAEAADQEQQSRKLSHRLKNNLQLVISIISLRISAVRDEARRRELEDVLSKIHAVALIQKKLHEGGQRLTLDFDEFLRELTQTPPRPSAGGKAPRIVLDAAPIEIGIERAMPLGLIANELIALAAAHGAAEAPLTVGLAERDGRLELTVARAGLAQPDEDGRPDSGMALVRALARQIHGVLAIEDGVVRLTTDAERPPGS